jgi:hypothetical protein
MDTQWETLFSTYFIKNSKEVCSRDGAEQAPLTD